MKETTTTTDDGPPTKKARHSISSKVENYLKHLPSSQSYEVSYAHRDIVTSVCVSNPNAMVLSGSADGVVKFWKRIGSGAPATPVDSVGIEFVKSYQGHSSAVLCMKLNYQQNVAVSIGLDAVVKFYDVLNFDVTSYINTRLNLKEIGDNVNFAPHCCFIGKSQTNIAVATTKGDILIFDTVELQLSTSVKLHGSCIVAMDYNYRFGTVISGDSSGVIEIWKGEDDVIGNAPDR